MDNSAEIYILLSSIKRSLNPIFKHWLNSAQMQLTKEGKIDAYLNAIERPEKFQKVLEKLSLSAKCLLEIAAEYQGQLTVASLLGAAVTKGYNINKNVIGELHHYGIAFYDEEKAWPSKTSIWQENNMQKHLLIPAAFLTHKIDLKPVKIKLKYYDTQSENACDSTLSSKLNKFLTFAGGGKLKINQSQEISTRSQNLLLKNNVDCGVGVTSINNFLDFALAIEILIVDSTGQIVPLKSFAKFRQKAQHEEFKKYLTYYFEHLFSAQSRQIEELQDYIIFKLISKILKDAPRDKWVSIDEISKVVFQKIENLFIEEQAKWNWKPAAEKIEEFEEQKISERLVKMLENCLIMADIAKTGRSEKGLEVIKATSYGDYFLTEKAAPSHDDQHQKLIIQPDFTAILTHSGPWDMVAKTMALFGERTGDDNASIFHFSQKSIHDALEHGHLIDQLIELFARHSTYPVPENIIMTLKEWGKHRTSGKIHRDVNLFAFDTKDERDIFISQNPKIEARAIGVLYAMTAAKEAEVFNMMNLIHALPVDYTQPPVEGLDITSDGRIICLSNDDLRVTSLRDMLATKKGDNYYLSSKKIAKQKDPALIYNRIQKLPGRKLNFNSAINLLIVLKLLPEQSSYYYLNDFAKLKREIPDYKWRRAISAKVSTNIVILKNESLQEVIEQLNQFGKSELIKTYNIRKIPINECK